MSNPIFEQVSQAIDNWRHAVRALVRPAFVEHQGRAYKYSDKGREYQDLPTPRDLAEHAPSPTVLDVASLSRWCHMMDNQMDHGVHEKARGIVVLSRKGKSRAETPLFIGPDTQREMAVKPFFMGFMPGEQFEAAFGYIGFTTWLELLGPERLDNYDAMILATKSVSASEGAVTKIETEGAFIKVHTEATKGGRGSAPMPKAITATIPFGDPGCELTVRFRLSITARNGELRFHVTHVSTDGAFDAYVAWMMEQLTDPELGACNVPAGWTVLAAP
jgi:hypothetical protein